MFAFTIIFLVLAVIALVVAQSSRKGTPQKRYGFAAAGLFALGTAVFAALSSFYVQDVGTAVVVKNITGTIAGSSIESGPHAKAPWQSIIEFDIRNQQVIFAGATAVEGTSDNAGGQADGPQITVQDADGVSSNIDIALRYSINADAVIDIYTQFKDGENFKSKFIEQDIRSVVRQVPNNFKTLDLITKRADVENGIRSALETRWAKDGVSVDSISLQEIRPPQAVVEAYSSAQTAQVKVQQAQNELEATKVQSQQQVVQAKAAAEANAALEKSLTPQVLKQHALDTMALLAAKGNLVITDAQGSTLLNVAR